MSGYIGFSPDGVATLRTRTSQAVSDLSGLTHADPEAAPAIVTARLIRFSIETIWLPRLTALTVDTSMTAWGAVAQLIGLLAALGAAQSGAVDEAQAAAQHLLDGDHEAVAELNALLAGLDPATAAAFLAELGPDDYFDVMMRLGQSDGNDVMRLETATRLRDLLAYAPDGFVAALGVATDARIHDWTTAGDESLPIMTELNPLATADFMAESEVVGAAFSAGLLTMLVSSEHAGRNVVPTGFRQDSLFSGATSGTSWVDDAVAGALGQIATDPVVTRQMFSDTDFARYVVLERDYGDGFTGMMAFIESAAAGPDAATAWEESSRYATQSAFWLSQRDIDMAMLSDEASVSASRIVATHVVAAEITIAVPERSTPLDPDFLDDPTGLAPHTDLALGMDGVVVAIFEPVGLDLLTTMAAQSDEGILYLRNGVNILQQASADGTAELLSQHPDDAQTILDRAMETAGHLEGYFIDTVGHSLQADAAAADRRTGLWISALALPAPAALGATGLGMLAPAVGPSRQWLTAMLANEQDTTIAMMNLDAQHSAGRLTFLYAQALMEAGVIAAPPGLAVDDDMTYDDFMLVPPDDFRMFWEAVAACEDVSFDTFAIPDSQVLEQQPAFEAA